ncbi:hypothetical protein CDD80_5453 [Ophiocordyceps camponoti-rufipedis]|uniref:Uncharacterized protein n=1 Tax=Ophiocordyceps camponoti-rufipedis TaxID=2004952 RepID=A0A2C5XU20_9HYPO|nr:hypothetical protein CDD80_5453 [Ophiocordyceps camponoti-rufipedis]
MDEGGCESRPLTTIWNTTHSSRFLYNDDQRKNVTTGDDGGIARLAQVGLPRPWLVMVVVVVVVVFDKMTSDETRPMSVDFLKQERLDLDGGLIDDALEQLRHVSWIRRRFQSPASIHIDCPLPPSGTCGAV